MLKYALLGAAMAMTAPALAQTATGAQTATPAPAQVTSTTGNTAAVPQTSAAPTAPISATPDATAAAPADTAAQTAADPAAQPAAGPDQVASVVDSQFGTYDKDADGKLSAAEFGTWMVALKSQTDPATDADSPATKKWNQAAFAQADTDKSKSVTKAELTGFLAPAAKS
jgi:hypothetical protein